MEVKIASYQKLGGSNCQTFQQSEKVAEKFRFPLGHSP